MEYSIEAAKAGVTTGEWSQVLRDVYGEFKAPPGISNIQESQNNDYEPVRKRVEAISDKIGRRIKFLVGKPGLDGHSSGAEQIAVSASVAADITVGKLNTIVNQAALVTITSSASDESDKTFTVTPASSLSANTLSA